MNCPLGCSYEACDRNGSRTECNSVCCPAFPERSAGQGDTVDPPGVVGTRASTTQIAAARALYASDDIAVDSDALLSDCGDGAYWVQAWVYVDTDALACADCDQRMDPLPEGVGVWDGEELVCRTCAELLALAMHR